MPHYTMALLKNYWVSIILEEKEWTMGWQPQSRYSDGEESYVGFFPLWVILLNGNSKHQQRSSTISA